MRRAIVAVAGQERARVDHTEAAVSVGRRRLLAGRGVALLLVAVAVLSALLRMALLSRVQAPTVFSDELGYERLAQSLGQTGHLALFGKEGLSYSPLYAGVLAPIFALGASAPTAYEWIKVVNALLMSLSILPVYKIARFALPRRESVIAAALASIAPVMLYSSFAMSENLAYPLCLVAFWAMLEAVRDPRPRNDALLLGAIVLATAARLQLIVLLPAAFTAIALATLVRRADLRVGQASARAFRQHWLLVAAAAALVAAAGARAAAGHGVLSIAGRYSNAGSRFPSPGHLAEQIVRHAAGLDLAVGVVPFVAAIVAAVVFLRSGSRSAYVPFAAVSLCVTVWFLLETAFDASAFDGPGDLPRIHERYLIYLVPLFIVAGLAVVRLAEERAPRRLFVAAAGVAALLPALIPFHTIINNPSLVDSFGVQMFARAGRTHYVPIQHATLAAVWGLGTIAMVYVVVRQRLRAVVVLMALVFLVVSSVVRMRIESVSQGARSALPAKADWVDRANPRSDVVLLAGAGVSARETAFLNLSIARIYSLCTSRFGSEFGEQPITADPGGRLVVSSAGAVNATYAVAPAALHLRGRVIARNVHGGQVLVKPPNGRLSVPPAKRSLGCKPGPA